MTLQSPKLRPSLCLTILLAAAVLALSGAAALADVSYEDPTGDDFGPGTYTYPTDAVYKRGTFDITKVEIKGKGSKVEFKVTYAAAVKDPWDSKSWDGNGFSLQMAQVYLDSGKGGFTKTLPGINADFAEGDAWDKVVIISPQPKSRLSMEVKGKAGALASGVVYPTKVTVRGKTIIATVKKGDLGGVPDGSWGVQVVSQSNEGYPGKDDVLTRKVNEFAGQHRFGGGNDWDCDPHALDVLVAPAAGGDAEKEGQRKALAYECGSDGKSVKSAVLPMVRSK